MALAFYSVNSVFAFFVTGVDTRLVLPLALNAPIAFMALIGFAMAYSTYVSRDVVSKGFLDVYATLVVLTVSFVTSISMASRAAIAMQAIPILAAATYVQSTSGVRKVSLKPFILFGLVFLAVLAVVSIYRISVFYGGGVDDSELVIYFAIESAFLTIDRWIGAEALMVAVSEPSRSMSLFFALLMENPATGVNAIYPVLSGSGYASLDGLTFLSLPGYFGVLGLSGSLLFVFLSTFSMALFGMAFEGLITRILLRQVIPVALASAALANSLTQISFPYLVMPFVVQILALVFILRFLMVRGFGLRLVETPPLADKSHR